MIRNVQTSDAPRIAEIYNYYIENTVITFEEETVTSDEITQRIENILRKKYPYLVYEENDNLYGYAYLNNWRSRSAYDITLETSIYLAKESTGKGLGRQLYAELIKRAREMKLHSLIGSISLPNEPSRKLHERFNFNLIGNFRESGKKFDKFIDVEFWQLML